VLYDLATSQSQLLFADYINDTGYLQARFSPNGEWLMLEFVNELRFLHIEPLLPIY
jgi:hypothetical protein